MTAFYYDKNHVIKRSVLEGVKSVIFKKPVDPTKLKNMILEQCGRAPARKDPESRNLQSGPAAAGRISQGST
jgi:hypothetical protein